MKLTGSVVIITGASQGLGFAVATAFLREGAKVAICARDAKQLEQAKQSLLAICPDESSLYTQTLDISHPKAVQAFVENVYQQMGRIDVLVSNAGVHGPKGCIDEVDWEEWSYAIDVNLKGSVIMSRAVLPYMKKNGKGKMIFLSGGGATKPMPYFSAYAASKAAVVRYAETLAEELKPFHIDVNAVAPGAMNTRLLEDVLKAGPEKVGEEYYAQCVKQKEHGGSSRENAAALCTYLASHASDGISGKLISAVWDPWKQLDTYKEQLLKSDIYTLRRIIPEDRGYTWQIPSE